MWNASSLSKQDSIQTKNVNIFCYTILKSEKKTIKLVFSIKRKNAVFGEIHNGNLCVRKLRGTLTFQH